MKLILLKDKMFAIHIKHLFYIFFLLCFHLRYYQNIAKNINRVCGVHFKFILRYLLSLRELITEILKSKYCSKY